MERWSLPDGGVLSMHRGDLVRAGTDAIVNAANSALMGGGGVDGAIHRAAGPNLLEACRRIPVRAGVRCPVGEARLTPGFDLVSRFVVHTVGPVYARDPDPAGNLAAAHRASLQLARDHELRTIAFPAISCGLYGYPAPAAAEVAVRSVVQHGANLDEIRFVLFSDDIAGAWRSAAIALLGEPS